MPELPDIEGYRRLLRSTLVGHTLTHVTIHDPSVIHGIDPDSLSGRLIGRTATSVERLGKWLVISVGAPERVVLHMGMTGTVVEGSEPGRFARLSCDTANSRVTYRDRRKLGGVWVTDDVLSVTGALGPDAARITRSELGSVLNSPRPLKTLLIDQSTLAGLGNMLSDEVAWAARINPRRKGNGLTVDELDELHHQLKDILRRAVRAGHIPRTRGWLAQQRAAERPICPRCGSALERPSVGGRRALMCPRCQPPPSGQV